MIQTDFDDLAQQVKIDPNSAKNILNFIIREMRTELEAYSLAVVPRFGDLVLRYLNGEPHFYLKIGRQFAEFEPEHQTKELFRKS